MASTQSTDLRDEGGSVTDRVWFVLSKYRTIVYGALAVLAIWMSGYALDVLAGPYNESTKLVHIVSGLLGAAALVVAICGLVVALLWAGLVLSNR